MARRKKGELPRYRLHKQSGQAVVSLPLGGGKYRDVLLGPFDTEESKREYTRVINEWLAAGMLAPPKPVAGTGIPDLSVAEVCLRFWKHAEDYYRLVDGSPSGEIDNYQYAHEFLVEVYGPTPVSEFGPLKLKAVRRTMIDAYRYHVRFTKGDRTWDKWVGRKRFRYFDGHEGRSEAEWKKAWLPVELLQKKKAICRKEINRRVELIRRMFRWAVSEELVSSSVYQALMAVKGLRRGHPGTYEMPKVKPVPHAHVEAVLPFLCPQVAAMVQLQPLIGARETEICLMRSRDIDRSGPVWWYKIDPNEAPRHGQPVNLHKTAHVEGADGAATVKLLPIGPKAQTILRPWLRENEDDYLFQPREARRAKYERTSATAQNTAVVLTRRPPGPEEEVAAQASATGALRPPHLRPCHRTGLPESRGAPLAPTPVETRLRDRRAQEVWPGGFQGVHGAHEAVHSRDLRREGHGTGREDRPRNGLTPP